MGIRCMRRRGVRLARHGFVIRVSRRAAHALPTKTSETAMVPTSIVGALRPHTNVYQYVVPLAIVMLSTNLVLAATMRVLLDKSRSTPAVDIFPYTAKLSSVKKIDGNSVAP